MLNSYKFLMFASLLLLGLGLSACNTISGAGQDIENAGEGIQDAAN